MSWVNGNNVCKNSLESAFKAKKIHKLNYLENISLTTSVIVRPVGDSEAHHPVERCKDGGDEGQGPVVHHLNPEYSVLYCLVVYMGNLYHFALLASSYPVVMPFLITWTAGQNKYRKQIWGYDVILTMLFPASQSVLRTNAQDITERNNHCHEHPHIYHLHVWGGW